MIVQILEILSVVDEFFWTFIGAPGLIGLGLYFSIKSRFFQIRQFPKIVKIFFNFAKKQETVEDEKIRGIAPIHAFFAAVGGAIGVGNLVSVCIAVQIGGPGAVFWLWLAALFGMLIKYGEIYLGIKFRIQNNENSYSGGPMIYLQHVPGGWFWSKFSTILMCLYGIEVYIFREVTHCVSVGWYLPEWFVIPTLLFLVVGIGQGGVKLVGKICSIVIPLFLVGYISMGCWVIVQHIHMLPTVFASIFKHAFTPHAAVGAFTGNTLQLAISHGVKRACYTGDIGIGYASTMHAETKESVPAKQASLGVIDIFLDSFVVCTMSLMLILFTGVWHQGSDPGFMVSEALAICFPGVQWIWSLFIFLLGYTTLIAFFAAGRRSATILSPKYGAHWYSVIGVLSFALFSMIGTRSQCLSMMSIVGSLLLVCNLYGLFALKNYIVFDVSECSKK